MTTNTAPAPTSARADFKAWFQDLPLDVRFAVAVAYDAGLGVDEGFEGGPVFYEVKAPLIGQSANIGTLMGNVGESIEDALSRAGVDPQHASTIRRHLRAETLSSNYNDALNTLMRWVAVATDED